MAPDLARDADAGLPTAGKTPAGEGGFPSIMLFLSLYLLLLAVFIMLNSIARFEDSRTRRAIGSVIETFQPDLEVRVDEPTENYESGDTARRETFITQLRSLFALRFPLVRIAENEVGDLLQVELPAGELFLGRRASLNPATAKLVAGMADALARRVENGRFEVELLIFRADGLPDSQTPRRSLEIVRADLFARALRRMGVPAQAIKVGVGIGPPGRLRLRFQQRTGRTGVIDFDDDDGEARP